MEISDNTSNRLRDFAVTFFESVSEVVEPLEDDLIEVLLPKELVGQFSTDFQVALDPEVAQEQARADLLIYGSPILDNLVAFTGEQGTVAAVYLTALNLDASNMQQNLKRGIRFEDANIRINRTKVKLFKYLLFTFKVRYPPDE